MQGQFGLVKRKPLIFVEPTDDKKNLIIRIGFIYYQTVPNDSSSVQYRLLVGQLALAGFSIVSLMNIFDFTRPTIMRYKNIVKNTPNEAELFAKLRGLNSEKTKLRPDVEAYIVNRFKSIYCNNRATYNQQLRNEVLEKFSVEISGEALRRIIQPFRKQIDSQTANSEPENCNPVQTPGTDTNSDDSVESWDDPVQEMLFENNAFSEKNASAAIENGDNPQFYFHAGLLLLNVWLADFVNGFKNWQTIFLQWLYQIFAGAVNFEQARYLPLHELKRFMGKGAVSISQSRLILNNLAYEHFQTSLQVLFETNLQQMKQHWEDKAHYFYIDGHFDPYYGSVEILKGWSCLLNRAMKGTNHYVIHDAQGYPVAKELKDCFDDFRIFLKHAIGKIRLFVLDTPFGIVFDRGGFSEDLFGHFDAEGVYFITWEKYFDIDKEQPSDLKFENSAIIEREINEVGCFKRQVVECAETTYRLGEEFSCRKIIIHPQNPDETEDDFYASILTNDPNVDHQLIVTLMTGRWCQENDFKYEKKHFGLDQITSYARTPLRSIQPEIDEQNGQLEIMKQQQSELLSRQAQLYNCLGIKRLTQKRIRKIQNEAREQPRMYESMVALQAIQPQRKEFTARIGQLKKKIKRLERIENRGYIKLDYRKKMVLDHIRFTARNIFYEAVSEFRLNYTNLRDLHVVFWKLVRSPGRIEFDKEQVRVTLYCPFFQGRVQKAVQDFLINLNLKNPRLLDSTNRKIIFNVNLEIAN